MMSGEWFGKPRDSPFLIFICLYLLLHAAFLPRRASHRFLVSKVSMNHSPSDEESVTSVCSNCSGIILQSQSFILS